LSDVLQTDETADAEVGAGETVGAAEAGVSAEAEAAPRPAAFTVGRSLSTARVAAGLTIAEVAQTLKFSPRQIEALEADDYDSLPGNTIVRGFVRSYGKLLKLNVEELLRILDARSPSAPADVRPPDNMGVASQPGVDRQFSPLLSAAIVLALAALLLALWHFFGPSTAKPASTTVTPVPQAAPAAAPPLAAPAPTAETGAAPIAPPASAAAAPALPGAALAVPAQLVFAFQDRCWLEVTDATKQKLHSAENPAGSRLTLSGKPPYDIVIGNATKVMLTYGERTIDLAPHTRADVARLTLE
jgi:cytoskeleton protein RodZ